MLKELLLSSILSFSVSVRAPNDVNKEFDYEFMTKIEKTDGGLTYLFKKDWERELGKQYQDAIGKFKYKSPYNAYCGVDWVDKNSKNIHYTTYNVGIYTNFGLSIGLSTKINDDEMNQLANIAFGRKFKKDDLEYNINVSIKSDLDDNNIFNVKSDMKRWITEKINIFGLYKHEYYNENADYQFKVGVGFRF